MQLRYWNNMETIRKLCQDYRICAPSALVETFESVFGKVFAPWRSCDRWFHRFSLDWLKGKILKSIGKNIMKHKHIVVNGFCWGILFFELEYFIIIDVKIEHCFHRCKNQYFMVKDTPIYISW